jgi:hypothetical protein
MCRGEYMRSLIARHHIRKSGDRIGGRSIRNHRCSILGSYGDTVDRPVYASCVSQNKCLRSRSKGTGRWSN